MRLILFITLLLFNCGSRAQPGYAIYPLYFKVLYKGNNVIQSSASSFRMQWRSKQGSTSNWELAKISGDVFATDPLRSERVFVELKIYQLGTVDTMFINCTQSLRSIPFQAGHFTLKGSDTYLANMEVMNGSVIVNQDWRAFNALLKANKPVLMKRRYVYMSRENAPFEDGEPDVQYVDFRKSDHIVEGADNTYDHQIEIGKLYYAPAVSPYIYSIGHYSQDNSDELRYNPVLLESRDGCRSWRKKFLLRENVRELLSFGKGFFKFENSHPAMILIYAENGRVVDSIQTKELPCSWEGNMFGPCKGITKLAINSQTEVSDPLMAGSFQHEFHTKFSSNGRDYIRIDSLPYQPVSLHLSNDGGETWRQIIRLNSGDTYAYLTMRKNNLVLVSYHYTLVSLDFGKNWTFYHNGTFKGGDWNFIWLDDNTLVNVTNYYADVMDIR